MKELSEEIRKFLDINHGKRIVFTNGCFDILHRGHLSYLNSAKKLGDILIVGLNSDISIKIIKGNNRPINNQEDRKFFLENLRSVDWVETFDEQTPYNLIKHIRPNVLVKGGDWEVDQIVGSDLVFSYNGTVKNLPFEKGYSTTSFIKNMQGKI